MTSQRRIAGAKGRRRLEGRRRRNLAPTPDELEQFAGLCAQGASCPIHGEPDTELEQLEQLEDQEDRG